MAQQHIDLRHEKLFKNHHAKLVDHETPDNKLGASSETETGSAGEYPAKYGWKQYE